MDSWLSKARKTSSLTCEECAEALHCRVEDYRRLEVRPGDLRLNELRALRRLFNEESRRILWEGLREFEES